MVGGQGYEQLIDKYSQTLEKNPPLIDRRRVFLCPQPVIGGRRCGKSHDNIK